MSDLVDIQVTQELSTTESTTSASASANTDLPDNTNESTGMQTVSLKPQKIRSSKRMRSRSLDSLDSTNYDSSVTAVPKKRRGRRPKAVSVNAVLKPVKKQTKKSGSKKVSVIGVVDKNAIKNHDSLITPISATCGVSSAAVETVTQPDDLVSLSECSTLINSCSTIDIALLTKTVSECLAVQLSPMASAVKAMHSELLRAKETVVALSSKVDQLSASLRATVQQQQLQQQQHHELQHQHNKGQTSNTQLATSQNQSSYASAAATPAAVSDSHPGNQSEQSSQPFHRKPRLVHETQQDAVTAMYVDLKMKKRRLCNIVISGLAPTDDCDDTTAVFGLLTSEFDWDLDECPGVGIAKCRRLGQPHDDRIQPLLVTLDSQQQAEYYVRNAKFLRGSNNSIVRQNVYINSDQTPSEAKASYELRIKRRQRAQERQADQIPSERKAAFEPRERSRRLNTRANNDQSTAASKRGRTFFRSNGHDNVSSAPVRSEKNDDQGQGQADVPEQSIRLQWRQPEPSVTESSSMLSSTTVAQTQMAVTESSIIPASSDSLLLTNSQANPTQSSTRSSCSPIAQQHHAGRPGGSPSSSN